MAATNGFETFVEALTADERKVLEPLIRTRREDLLAGRSEDARLRILNEFLVEAKRMMRSSKQ
jgi:hypothetical protein